jgi:hypothetical protein
MVESYGITANRPATRHPAARHRFMERSAADLVGMLNLGVPLLEMLEAARSRRAVNACSEAPCVRPVENTRLAWHGRLCSARAPGPTPCRRSCSDLELLKLRLIECRASRRLAAQRLARRAGTQPYLAPDDILPSGGASACPVLPRSSSQRRWIALFRAVAARDAEVMARHAPLLLSRRSAN